MSTKPTPDQTTTSTDPADNSATRRHTDLARLARAAHAPRCAHVKTNGLRCGSPAMRRNPYCYFHDRYLNQPYEDTFPPFEDGNAVQFALMQIVERLRRETFRDGAVDPRFVKPLIFAVKTAAQNLRNTSFDPAQEQSVIVDTLNIPADQDQTVPLAPRTFNPPPRPPHGLDAETASDAATGSEHGTKKAPQPATFPPAHSTGD